MMSFAGVGVAALCGIATAYVTFQPELEKQRAERLGEFKEVHRDEEAQKRNDQQISQAIFSDFKEAKEEAKRLDGEKGFAWGIREAIWGKPGERVKEGGGAGDGKPEQAKG